MAFRNIVTWPSPLLKKKSDIVTEFDDELKNLAKDMYDTMNVVSGVGLAAPQVGVHKRCVVIDANQAGIDNTDPEDGLPDHIIVLVNPELTLSGPRHKWVEACLSVPDSKGMVERNQHAHVSYQMLDGTSKELQLDWPASGVFQHECDHLDGILYVDRMSRLSKDMLLKKIIKKRKKMQEMRRLFREQERNELAEIDGRPKKKTRAAPGKKKRKRPPKKNHLNKRRKRK